MTTATNKRNKKPVPASDDRTISPLDAELPKQSESLPGQQTLPVDLPRKCSRGEIFPREGLVDFLRSLDMQAFLDAWPRKELQRRVDAKYGTARRTRVTARELRKASDLAFKWYRRGRLRPETRTRALDEADWNHLKRACEDLLEHMQGRTLAEYVRLMRTRVACNHALLEGLPSRLRVWRKSP